MDGLSFHILDFKIRPTFLTTHQTFSPFALHLLCPSGNRVYLCHTLDLSSLVGRFYYLTVTFIPFALYIPYPSGNRGLSMWLTRFGFVCQIIFLVSYYIHSLRGSPVYTPDSKDLSTWFARFIFPCRLTPLFFDSINVFGITNLYACR